MRALALLVGTSMLAACGGSETGIASGGSIPAGGSGGASTGIVPGSDHTFENPTEEKTYQAHGSLHKFEYVVDPSSPNGQGNRLYTADATTVRNGGITLNYDPRDAVFELVIAGNQAGVDASIRFQDPAHRIDFGGSREPQSGVSDLDQLNGIQYLEVASGTNSGARLSADDLTFNYTPTQQTGQHDVTTLFYQRPGTTTKYVTYAGFLRNQISGVADGIHTYALSRAAFVFGETSPNSAVPTSGRGVFTGDMVGSAVLNDRIDDFDPALGEDAPTYFQWIQGTANLDVNFGSNIFSLDLTATTSAPQLDFGTSGNHTIREGATFNANGSGNINLVAAGGFVGAFQQAWFTNPDNSQLNLLVAGSSIDGAFYGPNAEEAAGNFRIVGGTPDERIDVLGVFTGSQ